MKKILNKITDFIIELLGGININKIIIKKEFKEHYPSSEKMIRKAQFHFINGYFQDNIIINENNELIDGYITYMIARSKGIKHIAVQRVTQKNKSIEEIGGNKI